MNAIIKTEVESAISQILQTQLPRHFIQIISEILEQI